uniref:Glyco_hydro_38C domain-containing protein n=1 Tax=Strongyloides papillosus TaxID=174720 RepID=A0A0N5BHR5_STREA
MNPLGHEKNTVICIKVPSNDFYILTDDRSVPIQEYHPVIESFDDKNETNIDNNGFDLCFEALLPPLGLVTYTLERGIMYKPPVAQISLSKTKIKSNHFDISSTIKDNRIKNSFVDVTFNSKTGFIDSIDKTKIDLHFTKYGVMKDGQHSGPYIFHPDGPSKRISEEGNIFIISEGKLKSTVFVKGSNDVNLYHTYEITKFDKSITIQNSVDISKLSNFELGMKFATSINNKDTFYTDLNGFQMIKRRHLPDLPLQGNFYPFPSMMYIEDTDKRLSILTGQPLGVSSLDNGNVEILIDRRSDYDDECGMGQGIRDTLKAWSKFSMIVEDLIDNQIKEDSLTGFVSGLTHQTLYSLLYPPIIMTTMGKVDLKEVSDFSIFKNPLPCDVHLVMGRSLLRKEDYDKRDEKNEVIRSASNEIALIFKRFLGDCRVSNTNNIRSCKDNETGKILFTDLLNINYKAITETSLTLLNVYKPSISHIDIDNQEMKTIKIIT